MIYKTFLYSKYIFRIRYNVIGDKIWKLNNNIIRTNVYLLNIIHELKKKKT